MMDELVRSFRDSLFNSALKDVAVDVIEIGLDAVIDIPVIQDLPVVKTIVGVGQTIHSIHQRNMVRQTEEFILEFNRNHISQSRIQAHKNKLNSDPKYAEKELGRVLYLLDSWFENEKSRTLAKLYSAYVDKKISWEEFYEFSEITARLFPEDWNLLCNDLQRRVLDTAKDPVYRVSRLESLGLTTKTMYGYRDGKDYAEPLYYSSTSELGEKYYMLCWG